MKKTLAIASFSLFAATLAGAQQYQGISAQDFAAHHFAQGDEAGYNLRSLDWSDNGVAASSGDRAAMENTMAHFAQDDEPGYGSRKPFYGYSGVVVGSSHGASRGNLTAIAAAKLDNGEPGDN